ncbi:MAG: rhodanese-like domain-containing protein [Bacteroidota bacterium]
MRRLTTLMIGLIITSAGDAAAQNEKAIVHKLKASEFKSKLETTRDAVLLDVRMADEVAEGLIPNAMTIDFSAEDFPRSIEALDKEKTYFVYCASGGQSNQTALLMADMGFKKVYCLVGGISAWKEKKYPIKKN